MHQHFQWFIGTISGRDIFNPRSDSLEQEKFISRTRHFLIFCIRFWLIRQSMSRWTRYSDEFIIKLLVFPGAFDVEAFSTFSVLRSCFDETLSSTSAQIVEWLMLEAFPLFSSTTTLADMLRISCSEFWSWILRTKHRLRAPRDHYTCWQRLDYELFRILHIQHPAEL